MPKNGEQSTNKATVGRRSLQAVLALVLALTVPSAGAPARWSQLTQHLTGRPIVGEGTVLHETVQWGDDVTIGAGVSVGEGVVIGSEARLSDGASLPDHAIVSKDGPKPSSDAD